MQTDGTWNAHTSKSVVDNYVWFRREVWHDFGHHIGMPQITFWRNIQYVWVCFWIVEGKRTMPLKNECSRGYSDIQKQRRSVESKVSKIGGPRLCGLLRSEMKTGRGPYKPWKNQRMGNQDNDDTLVPFQKTQRRFNRHETWVDLHTWKCNMARKIWIQMGLLFCEKIAESMWRAVGWACEGKSNVVMNSPGEVRDGGTRRKHVDKTPTQNTHLCSTVCPQARNAHHALGSSRTDCGVIFVRLKRFCHLVSHMSHFLLFSHLPFTTSTSSSSCTLPSTTTQGHAAHISKLSQPTSCTIKNHSCVKTCRVAETRAPQLPQVVSPQSLRLSQGAKIILEIQINCMMYRKIFGEEGHRAPNTEEVKEFGEIETAGLPNSKMSETSYFQSQIHFDNSVESIADSDFEDGVLQEMLTSPLCPESLGETRCNGHTGERGKCTKNSSRAKRTFEVSFIWRSESWGESRCIVFVWTGKLDQEFCVRKRQSVEFEWNSARSQ